jgi:histone demethylase JARID1
VNEEGGYEIACRERKWSKIASRLTYGGGKGVGSTLRQHYEKVLYPFDLFQAGVTLGADVSVQSSPPRETDPPQFTASSVTDKFVVSINIPWGLIPF